MRLCRIFALSLLLFGVAPTLPALLPAVAETAPPSQPEVEAAKLMLQGLFQLQKNQYQAALQSLQTALQLYQTLENRQGQLIVLNTLASTYFYLGEYRQTIAISQQATELMQMLGDSPEAAVRSYLEMTNSMNLGLANQYLGQYQQAIEQLRQSLELARQVGQPLTEATALVHLADTYRAVGKYQQAIQACQQALILVRTNPPAEATQDPVQQALAPAIGLGIRQVEAGALTNLGIAYSAIQDYDSAIQVFEQALTIARQVSDRQLESRALLNLGNTYLAADQPQRAVAVFQQSLELAQAVGDRQGEAIALGNLGLAYRNRGDVQQAIRAHQQSLALKRELGDRPGEAITLSNLGYALLSANRPEQAEPLLYTAIEILEDLRTPLKGDSERVSLFNTQRYAYENLQNALVAQQKTDTALEIAERGRARAFVELLSRHSWAEADSAANSANLPVAVDSPTLAEIQQVAKAQQATLVEYSIIDDQKLFIWVVQPSGEVTFRQAELAELDLSQSDADTRSTVGLANPASLATIVTQTRSAVIADQSAIAAPRDAVSSYLNDPTYANQLRTLHQMLIQPIADLLPADPDQRLIFIPQGSLFLVPFPALQASDGTYLIEHHTILTAPAIQLLTHSRQAAPHSSRPLIVGNPAMPQLPASPGEAPVQLAALPGAELEAQTIASLFHTKALTGSQATETAIVQQMQTANIVHLATHGLLQYGQPDEFGILDLPGAIALAPSPTDDGLLTASEILALQLNADLVVLSACDTGRGRITEDGVIGLSRSLIAAGAPSVIVSLWTASDLATSELMSAFYQQLQLYPDKAQALRQAMLTVMQNYPHPRDWAAFTLIDTAQPNP